MTRSTTPETIEPDLAALWRDVAREGRVARAVMSNLIVVREDGGRAHQSDSAIGGGVAIDDVAARHPCRLILLDHQRDSSDMRAPFSVTIGILTFGPETARYGIEQIAVQSTCAETRLPSIVSQLVRGDVPTSVWWMDDISRVPPIDALVRMGRQFVYDSRDWRDVRRGMAAAASLLRSELHLDLADLNWRRLAPVRQALRHTCSMADLDELRLGRVRIVHRPGDGALAWLAAGWLASRLGWSRGQSVRVGEELRGDAVLTIEVGEAPSALTAVLDSHQVVARCDPGTAPLTVAVPRENEANAVAAELRNLSHDVCLHDAIEAAALLLQ